MNIGIRYVYILPESNKLFSVRAEFPEEAGRLLDVDEGEPGKDVGVEAAMCVYLITSSSLWP